MLVRRVRRTLAIGLAAAVGSVVLPASASASTATVVNHVLYYAAAPGETNNVSISYPNGLYTVYDPGVSQMTAGSGCSPGGSHTVTCGTFGSLTGMSIDLGDGNDVENSTFLFVTPVTVHGGAGNDTISTGGAADYLDGGPGNDTLNAGSGDDTLDGGMGADVLHGGNGVDTVTYGDRVAPVSASIDGQANDGEAGEGDNIETDVESLIGGSAGDTLTGSAAGNALVGGGGNDNLSGLDGDDVLDGGAGADHLDGGAGADTLKARDGEADSVVCGSEVDSVQSDTSDSVAADCENVDSSGAVPSPTGAGAGPAGGAGSPAGTVLPSPAVTITTSQATLTASGALAIKLACPKQIFEGCAGTITIEVELSGADAKKLSMARRRKLVKLATKRFRIPTGRSRVVVVHMSRRGKRFFSKHRKAKVTVTVAIKSAAGVTTTTRKISVKARSYRHAPGAKGRHR